MASPTSQYTTSEGNLARAAAGYALRGWAVSPLRPQSKEPLTAHGYKDATVDPQTIARWWQACPDANVGIATGGVSGVVVLDVDPRAGGDESLRDLEARFGPLPDTVTALTGGGGQHYYFALPQGAAVRSRRVAPGLDLKGEGGYVVAPPSVHPSGGAYQWEIGHSPDDLPLAPLPTWLLEGGDGPGRRYEWDGRPIPEGERNISLASIAGSLRARGLDGQAIFAALRAINEAQCQPPLPESEVKRIAYGMERYPPHPNLPGGGHGDDGTPAEALERVLDEAPSDYHHGRIVARALEGRACYVPAWGWMVWTGRRWERDEEGDLVAAWGAEALRDHYIELARATKDPKQQQVYLSTAAKVLSRAKAAAALAFARAWLRASPDEFDQNPYLLNTANGTIDLRTGTLRSHDPRDRITKLIPLEYDPNAGAPTWQQFLQDVFQGDDDLIDFVHKAVGYSATGDVSEDCFFLCYGSGSNGKTTFLNAIRRALGDYAQAVPPDLLVSRRERGDSHPAVLADLQGVRFAMAAETQEDRRLDEARAKMLTGRDPIKARHLHKSYFEFEPTHKIWLATNHLPVVRDTTEGMWRRVRVVPFLAYFGPDRRDKGLPQKLEAEAPGVLAWVVQGAVRWFQEGLGEARAVSEATSRYRSEMDTLADWLQECCITDPAAITPFAALYDDYVAWCQEAKETPISKNAFGRKLGEKGFEAVKLHGNVKARRGLRLRPDGDPGPGDRLGDCGDRFDHTSGKSPAEPSPRGDFSRISVKSVTQTGNRSPDIQAAFEAEGAAELLGPEDDIEEGPGPPHLPRPCPRCRPAGMAGYHICERGREVVLLRTGIDRERHVLRAKRAICVNAGLLRATEPDWLVMAFTDASWGWVSTAVARKVGSEGEFGAERQLAVPLAAITWEVAQPRLGGEGDG